MRKSTLTMMSWKWVRALGVVSLFFSGLLAAAPSRAEQPAAITASAGQFSALRGAVSYEVGWEFRFAPRRYRWLPHRVPALSPTAGAMATSKGTLYIYGGFRFDVPLGRDWSVSPQWATGIYYGNGGRELGGALEFRSGIELSRRIGERSRLGITLYHLSNADLYSLNPGAESVVLTYTARP
jgi:lipid A 3-O-deacylase